MGPRGFKAAGIASGLKADEGAKDLALLVSEVPAVVGGAFTKNRVKAAPVLYTRQCIRTGVCRAVLVNSGNANACTGERGVADARRSAKVVANALGIPRSQVLVSSTGVIGEFLPVERIERGVPSLVEELSSEGFKDAAQAIMTTDTYPKMVADRVVLEGRDVTIFGMAKGAGMIRPQLATMLAFVLTDATVDASVLSGLVKEGVRRTFNRITVDGETSTNDMVLVLANGAAGSPRLSPEAKTFQPFREALFDAMNRLAMAVVHDGEGRTKVVEVRVQGVSRVMQGERIAFRVAHSPLVKTALFGEDANWGRVMSALGDAGVPFDPRRVTIAFDDVMVVKRGMKVPETTEAQLKGVLQKEKFAIVIDLHQGSERVSVYTTDLSYDYVKINASYRS